MFHVRALDTLVFDQFYAANFAVIQLSVFYCKEVLKSSRPDTINNTNVCSMNY